MGSGVRIPLAAPIQVGPAKDGQGQQTFRHDLPLSVARINRDRVETREPRCWAVRPDGADVSALATTLPVAFSDAPGWAIDIEAAAKPNVSSLPGASSRFLGRRSPHWSFVAAAHQCVACLSGKLNPLQAVAKPPVIEGREGRQRRGQGPRRMPPQRHQYARDPIRPLRPIQFSPDRKRTHSPCCIPTTKSGAAPHLPLPQFPSPK
jgi:hypothetical protein